MKIIIGIDGSAQSLAAAKAVQRFPASRIECVLASVSPEVTIDGDDLDDIMREELDNYNQQAKAKAEGILREAQESMEGSHVSVRTQVLQDHPTLSAAATLCDFAKKEKADLVALGTRGLNPLQTFFLGSVAEGVLRQAPCPVLLQRSEPDGVHTGAWEKSQKVRVMVGFDDSPSAKRACKFLEKFNPEQLSEIEMAAAIPIQFYCGMSYSLAALDAWPKFKDAREKAIMANWQELSWQGAPPPMRSHILANASDIATELNAHAAELACDILMVGSQGKGMIDRLLIGSVSNRLAHMPGKLLLVVP